MSFEPNTLVVNLFGAPGSGKSTGAAYIFAKLKMAGIEAELVTEFAKDKTWEENWGALQNQAYVFGEQFYRIERVLGKVDVIITDSPILTSVAYNKNPALDRNFEDMVVSVHNSLNNLNYLLSREKYNKGSGRIQNDTERLRLHRAIYYSLVRNNLPFEEVPGETGTYDDIYHHILNLLNQ